MASPPTPPPTAADLQANPEPAPVSSSDAPASATPQPDSTAPAQPNAPQSAPSIPPPQDSNQLTFNTIFQLVSTQDLTFIDYAERAEVSCDARNALSRLLVICPLVLGYLITDDLPLAHAALNRLPSVLTVHPLVQALVSLLASTHKREYPKIYTRTDALAQVISQPDFFEPRLATAVAVLKDMFLYALRNRALKLFSRAYSSVPIGVVETHLGWSSNTVLEVVSKHGWTYDATTQILKPSKLDNRATSTPSGPSTLNAFHVVVDAVGRMES